MIQLIIFLLVSWFSACLNWINLNNHLKSRHIKAEVIFDSVLTGLPWRISANQSFRRFEYTSNWSLWRISQNQYKSKHEEFLNLFQLDYLEESVTINVNQRVQIKISEDLNILQIDHYDKTIKINPNRSMKNFWLCFN